jgi:hypothetical protein
VPPDDLRRFLGALFDPADLLGVRPIETWTDPATRRKCSRVLYKQTLYDRAGWYASSANHWRWLQRLAERERANLFFTVTPRFGPRAPGDKRRWDLAWQVRVVRALWADLDRCTAEEALGRCAQAGLAARVGGDHTGDLARLLRLVGTLNRKDQVNGREPVACELVACDPGRRYPFADFEGYAADAPGRARREAAARMRLPRVRKLTPSKGDRLDRLINACAAAPAGARSERDWSLPAGPSSTGWTPSSCGSRWSRSASSPSAAGPTSSAPWLTPRNTPG